MLFFFTISGVSRIQPGGWEKPQARILWVSWSSLSSTDSDLQVKERSRRADFERSSATSQGLYI